MNTRFKVFASHNILQYLCDFIHVLIFVTVSKCRKSPNLTNIVIGYGMFSEGINHNVGERDRIAGYLIKETNHTWADIEFVYDTFQRLVSEIEMC